MPKNIIIMIFLFISSSFSKKVIDVTKNVKFQYINSFQFGKSDMDGVIHITFENPQSLSVLLYVSYTYDYSLTKFSRSDIKYINDTKLCQNIKEDANKTITLTNSLSKKININSYKNNVWVSVIFENCNDYINNIKYTLVFYNSEPYFKHLSHDVAVLLIHNIVFFVIYILLLGTLCSLFHNFVHIIKLECVALLFQLIYYFMNIINILFFDAEGHISNREINLISDYIQMLYQYILLIVFYRIFTKFLSSNLTRIQNIIIIFTFLSITYIHILNYYFDWKMKSFIITKIISTCIELIILMFACIDMKTLRNNYTTYIIKHFFNNIMHIMSFWILTRFFINYTYYIISKTGGEESILYIILNMIYLITHTHLIVLFIRNQYFINTQFIQNNMNHT